MRAGTCKHFSGTGLRDKECCHAGVEYRSLVGGPDLGWCTRLPCYRVTSFKPNGPVNPCEKYEEPSQEEIDACEKEVTESIARFMKTLPLIHAIKTEHRGKNAKGTKKCTACDGVLHYTHAACNGHVWGKCETDGCLSWME